MSRLVGLRLLVFVVVAAVLTGAIAVAIVGAELGPRYRLVAAFDDASGLRAGDRVRLAGVPVGSVVDVEVVDGRAEVSLDVDRAVTLPRDTRAVVTWVDLLGNRQLDLEPGQDAAELTPDDRIERTAARTDIGVLATELGPLLGSLDPERIDQLLTSVDRILADSHDDLVGTTRDARVLVELLGERSTTIATMLADYRAVAETIGTREDQLRHLVGDLTALADAFGGSEQALVGTLDDATAVLASVESFLDANEVGLRRLVADLAGLVDVALERLDDLDHGLEVLPAALEGLFRVLRHGDYLRVDGVCLGFSEEPCIGVRSSAPERGR